jgi:hypothetical protein
MPISERVGTFDGSIATGVTVSVFVATSVGIVGEVNRKANRLTVYVPTGNGPTVVVTHSLRYRRQVNKWELSIDTD